MMWIVFVICLCFAGLVVTDNNKRLVLHSDTDLAGELLSRIANLEKQLASITVSENPGSSYIRWGKKTCPIGAELIYTGYMAGKNYGEPGSGTDNLCLPSDPVWGHYEDGFQQWRGTIWGTETDMPGQFFSQGVSEQDMPCSVCRSNKSITLMIPARKVCYPGWSLEYWGYLTGAAPNEYHGYSYACLDSNPDFLDHGSKNDNEHVLHLVEGHCGSLPCPPYVDGRELTCVVCSK